VKSPSRRGAAEPRIEAPLLGHRGDGEAAVIMRRIEQALLGQGEDLLLHRAVHRRGVAALEIGAAAAADQQAIAGEGHALVVEHEGQAAIGVPWRRAHAEAAAAEFDRVARVEQPVGAGGAAGA
jgi:hypothetical protein